MDKKQYAAIGRRKEAVARVRLVEGKGQRYVNGKPLKDFFGRETLFMIIEQPFQLTETQDKFRGLPLGARAVQIADGNTSNYFLDTFGRAKRETVCSCEVQMEPNLVVEFYSR